MGQRVCCTRKSGGEVMDDFVISFVIGAAVSVSAFVALLITLDVSDNQIKQQAFDRGYMVECVGKTGYYWECEK